MKENNTVFFKKGAADGIAIAVGYMPVAITFGLIAGATGLSVVEAVLMSMIVFAGAAQYMALSMIALGSGALEIVLATFIVNLRHLLMSASIHEKAEKGSKGVRSVYAFGMTDEVFAVASAKPAPIRSFYIIGVGAVAYGSWVGFTGVGFYMGSFLPLILQESMAIALYALFIALLVPSIKKDGKMVIILAGMGGLFHSLFALFLSTGWSIMFATILAVMLYEGMERLLGVKGELKENENREEEEKASCQ
ncbi:AzlC family ABC transporter permease [Bacillus sp. H-16]|uniref:AzlC family ABC transporter permease n=1 Tax=Alteribacter salitolerans TaxID=2912333 RepID=UPI0019641D03|nr:AzlC family ABC transporter permease [Alteribacter salitolerans]MBM7097869.1 AzlC family ABC transporter permease [Alteribacter salitolerans]